jgi:predicted secreted acid phosphatase
VPGVVGFIELVRRSGGRVAWITNRNLSLADATRENLKTVGLWNDDDRLCKDIAGPEIAGEPR